MGGSDAIAREVSEGKLEFGIVGSRIRIKRLLFKELWEDELVLVVHPSHRWAKKRAVSPEKLFREPFIQREEDSGTRQIIEQRLRGMRPAGFSGFRVISQLGSTTAVKEGIKNGLGVSILSKRAVIAEVKARDLKIVPLDSVELHRSFYLISDRGRAQSPLCRALFEFLQSDAAEDSAF